MYLKKLSNFSCKLHSLVHLHAYYISPLVPSNKDVHQAVLLDSWENHSILSYTCHLPEQTIYEWLNYTNTVSVYRYQVPWLLTLRNEICRYLYSNEHIQNLYKVCTYTCELKVFSKTYFNKCLAISSSVFHSGKSSLTLNIFPNKANHIDFHMSIFYTLIGYHRLYYKFT